MNFGAHASGFPQGVENPVENSPRLSRKSAGQERETGEKGRALSRLLKVPGLVLWTTTGGD